jgi:hypothetical protein
MINDLSPVRPDSMRVGRDRSPNRLLGTGFGDTFGVCRRGSRHVKDYALQPDESPELQGNALVKRRSTVASQ